jgi:hypothetical protein
VNGEAAVESLRSIVRDLVPPSIRPSGLLRRTVQAHTKMRVHTGPFRGLRLSDRAVWGAYIPKLLGTYELELRPCLDQIIGKAPKAIIDIGSAEGFYALGLLKCIPGARLVAFEQLSDARSLMNRMARVNGVENRLDIRGSCTPDELRAAFRDSSATFVLCDVEGYEVDLLDPARVPELAHVDMLVEVHDAQRPGCRAALEARFSTTHDLRYIAQHPRRVGDYPFRDAWALLWPRAILTWGLNEFRSPANGWLWMTTREPSDQHDSRC